MSKQTKGQSSGQAKGVDAENDFELLDVPGKQLSSWWADLQTAPVIVRAGAATLPGMIAGYIVMKVSKAAALGFGGGLLILFIASHYGLVTIHWDKLSRMFDEQKEGAEKSKSMWQLAVRKVREIAQTNPALIAGFVSGFLIGLAYG